MATCLVGLGSNLGDRCALLEGAVRQLRDEPQIRLTAHSRWIETQPVGGPQGQGEYLNGAVRLESTLGPEELLDALQRLETNAHRRRDQRWGARTLDLDLLLYGDVIHASSRLILPHPRMAFRRFVLDPAVEIAADMVHPTIGWTIERLWRHLQEAANYAAIGGPPSEEKLRFANELCQAISARPIAGDEAELIRRLRASSSGLAGGVAIEFLQRWRQLLNPLPHLESSTWRVSDFCFAELPTLVVGALAQTQYESFYDTFVEQWETASQQVIPPKLTIHLGPDPIGLGHNCSEETQGSARRMLEPTTLGGVGPMLHVQIRDWQAAIAETAASLDAMTGGRNDQVNP